ncbi:MAG: HEAT repeat domain-containing protein [Pirellula sp.]
MHSRFGFPIQSNYRFTMLNRRFRVGWNGLRMLAQISVIAHGASQARKITWLLGYRNQINKVEAHNLQELLTLVIERTPQSRIRLLAIWLRGRCGGTVGTSAIYRFASDPDEQTRKESVRALVRMSAWVQLASIAEDDPSPRIRRMACCTPPTSHGERLHQFQRNITRLQRSQKRAELYVSPEMEIRASRPSKSLEFIQSILKRIQHIVSQTKLRR